MSSYVNTHMLVRHWQGRKKASTGEDLEEGVVMGRSLFCAKAGIKKGPWTPEEDIILVSYIQKHGPGKWRSIPANTGEMSPSKFSSMGCRISVLFLLPLFALHEIVVIFNL